MRRVSSLIFVICLIIFTIIFNDKANAQFGLSITRCETVDDVIALIDTVFLDGVNPNQYKNISFTGDPHAVGYFNGGYIFGFGTPQGIVMSSGNVESLEGQNNCNSYANGQTSGGSDPDLAAASGQSIFDACIIEFDFMPTGDTARFNYIFGSEEYHEWVNTSWNDVFGFFLSGPDISGTYSNDAINIAVVPGTSLPVSISNVNCGRQQTMCTPPPGTGPNCEFLYDNTDESQGSWQQTALDAYTSPFVASNATSSCVWYHIKLAIGDAADTNYDSGVFLEKGSFDPGSVDANTAYTHPTVDSLLYESCRNHEAVLYFEIASPRNDPYKIPYKLLGTATNEIDYVHYGSGHGDTIYIEAGSLYDSIIIRPFWDAEIEGIEDVRLVYNPVMCGFAIPDTIITLISDVPDFPDTNRVYSIYCEDTIPIGFTDILEGIPPYNYQWFNSQWPVSYSTSAYVDARVSGQNNDYWYCLITDTCGYQSVDTAFVIIPELETDAGPDKSLCNMPSVQLEGISLGAQDYNWLSNPNDPSIIGQGNDTITVSPAQSTEYILVATDNCTNSDQDTAFVTLDGAVANASDDVSICLNDSITLSCNLGNTNETYEWTSNPPDPGLPLQSSNQVIKVSPTVTTIYSVLVTDDCNYQDTDEVEVVVVSLPVANAGIDSEVCKGQDFNLNASGGVGYQWGSIPADPSLYVNQQDTLPNPVVTPDSEINYKYFVVVSNLSGCVSSDTMVLTVNHVPDIQISPDNDAICFGNDVTLTAIGDIADDYQWSSVPPDPALNSLNLSTVTLIPETNTTYYLYATIGGINCPATPEYEITVVPQLYSTFEIADDKTTTCENEAIGVIYTGNGSSNADYKWDFGADAVINSGNGSGPYSVAWALEGNKTISLTLEEFGCPADTVDIDIQVIAVPVTDFTANPEEGCAELEVSFTNNSSKLDEPTYIWNIEGISSSDSNVSHIFTTPGLYPVTLTTTNKNLCSSPLTKSNYINVFEVPVADFEADPPESILEEAVISFVNNSTSNDPLSYWWYFDIDDSTNVENPVHEYSAEGVHLVRLIATTSNGCKHEINKNVIIHPDFAVYPPNAFTPNGDGENDYFDVKGTGVSAYALRIYSRWGELIFESKDLNDSWDGNINGSPAPSGTYVYKINYRSMIDREYTINGTVTVIR